MNALDGELRDGRHVMSVRVYYEDTDFSGIVYHATYLRFMERGRTNHLRLVGAGHRALFEQASAEAPGFAFVVRSMQIEFLKSARMDDVLEVMTAPEEVKGASITLKQQILRADELHRGARARRLRLRRSGAADSQGAAHGHAPRSGAHRWLIGGTLLGLTQCAGFTFAKALRPAGWFRPHSLPRGVR